MKIAEIYKSIQGEGRLTNTASIFVRASGCNLRCWFCDTPFSSWHPEGQDLGVEEILARCEEWDCGHVVITGGEPMLFAELIPLCEAFQKRGQHVTIETSGTLYLPVRCDLMSISPKLSNSTPSKQRDARWHFRHQEARHRPEVVRRLMSEYAYQLKFVIDEPEDCDEVLRYIDQISEVERRLVMLMPQGTMPQELDKRREWLVDFCQQHELTYCPRRQIEWFGTVRGT